MFCSIIQHDITHLRLIPEKKFIFSSSQKEKKMKRTSIADSAYFLRKIRWYFFPSYFSFKETEKWKFPKQRPSIKKSSNEVHFFHNSQSTLSSPNFSSFFFDLYLNRPLYDPPEEQFFWMTVEADPNIFILFSRFFPLSSDEKNCSR